MNRTLLIGILVLCLCMLATPVMAQNIPDTNERQPEQDRIKGYTDTPILPGTEWHVNDPNRPQPEVVTPHYDGEPVPPPAEATVLFDGSGFDQWTNESWTLNDNHMIVTDGPQRTKQEFGDLYLHLEWMVPESVSGWGQARGNSAVYLMDRYAVQVLDSWGNRTYPDGMVGAVYGQNPPRVNAARKPGQWQSYDMFFTAPETEDGSVTEPARVSVLHNGIPIQNSTEIRGKTRGHDLSHYENPPATGPIRLQDHGNAIRYRNIWVIPMDE